MLRFGSVLLVGLLFLSGCSEGDSSGAQAKLEIEKACGYINEDYSHISAFGDHLIKAIKLDEKYLPYLEMDLYLASAPYYQNGIEAPDELSPKYRAQIRALCAVNR